MSRENLTMVDATRLAFRWAASFGKGDGTMDLLAGELHRALGTFPLSLVEGEVDKLIDSWTDRQRPRVAVLRGACFKELARIQAAMRPDAGTRGGEVAPCCGEPYLPRPLPVQLHTPGEYRIQWRTAFCRCQYAKALRVYWRGNAEALAALEGAAGDREDVRDALRLLGQEVAHA